jgi:motA/tolQ/exbB family biopolymer transport prote in
MEQTSRISLWDILFSGGFLTDFFIVILLVLGVAALYLFFSKYFYLKEIGSKEEDFLDNVADCIYDHRIEAAMDWCKRVVSPESRIIKKGLENIEKSSFELFLSVQNQREAEITEIKKDIFKFELLAKIILLLGFLGAGMSFTAFCFSGKLDFGSEFFYASFLPFVVAVFIGMVVYGLDMILVSLIYKIETELKLKGNKFLEIVAEIK